MTRFVSIALAAASLLVCGCSERPTTLLVRIEAGAGVAAPALLRLRVIDDQRGVVVDDERLPPQGTPELPGEVVLYPPSTALLGLWARAYDERDDLYAQAAQRVTPRAGEQSNVTLVLRAGTLADSDGDGVPDVIDRCPDSVDPPSGPCPGSEGGPLDATRDGDSASDADGGTPDADGAPGDTSGDVPRCQNGADCDDNDVCTDQVCVGGFCQYTPVTCQGPTNPCDVARCDPQMGCLIEAAPAGTGCDDGKFCTDGDQCDGSGNCQSGPPRQCAAPACKRATCNESADRCDLSNEVNGTACDDGDPCTQREVCQAGTCTPPSGPLITQVDNNRNIDLSGRSSVAVSSAGAVHVVYNNTNNVWHGIRAPGANNFNTNDIKFNPGTTEYDWSAIAFDASDNLHLAFYDNNSNSLRYAKLPAGQTNWSASGANAVDSSEGWVSLVVRGTTVHIVHVRARAVRYLRLSTSTGALQGSDTAAPAPSDAGKTALYTALAIDSQDSAHVAYAYGTVGADRTAPQAETLFYATNRTGSFTQVAPSQVSAEHGAWNAIAVDDQSGAVYIGHSRFLRSAQGQAQLHVTWKASATGSWSDDTIAPLGSYKALVLGAAGTPHMIFRQFNQSPDRVMYATKSAGGWQLTQLDSGAGAGRWVQLTRAATGELHAMYEIDGQSRVMHLQQNACP